MKKIFSLVIVCLLCLGMVSCSNQQDSNLFSVIADGKTVYYGMPKDNMEEIIKQLQSEKDAETKYANFGAISVKYRDDKIVYINNPMEFKTGIGISSGDLVESLIEKLGEPLFAKPANTKDYLYHVADGKIERYEGTSDEWKEFSSNADNKELLKEYVDVSFVILDGKVVTVNIYEYYFGKFNK